MEKPTVESILSSYAPHEIAAIAFQSFIDRVTTTGADAESRRIQIGKHDLDGALRIMLINKMRAAQGRDVAGLVAATTHRTTPDPVAKQAAAAGLGFPTD